MTPKSSLFAALCFAAAVAPSAASADVDSLFTLGVGAQYAYVPSDAAGQEGAATRQMGLVSRAKILKFLGVEAATQIDQDPSTQQERLLSPRDQIGAMLNLIPTEHFNLFAVGGTGAHNAGDLFNSKAEDLSFHFGPGLEIFVGDHVALGADARFRMAGPTAIREKVESSIRQSLTAEALTRDGAPETIDVDVGVKVWQANFTVSFYL